MKFIKSHPFDLCTFLTLRDTWIEIFLEKILGLLLSIWKAAWVEQNPPSGIRLSEGAMHGAGRTYEQEVPAGARTVRSIQLRTLHGLSPSHLPRRRAARAGVLSTVWTQKSHSPTLDRKQRGPRLSPHLRSGIHLHGEASKQRTRMVLSNPCHQVCLLPGQSLLSSTIKLYFQVSNK